MIIERYSTWIWIGVLVLLILIRQGIFNNIKPWSNVKVTAVTYVYEQRTTKVAPGIRAGLNKLNDMGILATEFDVDTIDKQGGETPEQYKIPLAAAKKLPSLVATGGKTVIRVIENPQTEEDVLKVIK